MKKTIYGVAIALGLGLIVTACGGGSSKDFENSLKELEEDLNKVNYVESAIDSIEFSMILPDYMVATSTLQEGRPFQYMNTFKEQYIVASSEARSLVEPSLKVLKYEGKTLFDQYVSYNKEVLAEGVKITSEEPIKSLKIDGLEARWMQFNGTVEGIAEGICYHTVFIESETEYYFVMAWTLESKKDEFKPIAEKIIKSFHMKKK